MHLITSFFRLIPVYQQGGYKLSNQPKNTQPGNVASGRDPPSFVWHARVYVRSPDVVPSVGAGQ